MKVTNDSNTALLLEEESKHFVPADKEKMIEAHGPKSLKKEDYMTRMAFEDIDEFWRPIE